MDRLQLHGGSTKRRFRLLLGLTIDRVPPYCADFVAAFERGLAGDHMHLGHWKAPPPLDTPLRAGEFESAQRRLVDQLVTLADLPPRPCILDVACGLGGTLRLIESTCDGADLTGLNIDPRQIALCRRLVPRGGNRMAWIVGDADSLPLADSRFDAVFCVEAMFHFPDRARFLAEAARVLKPGGILVVSDILLPAPGTGFPVEADLVARILEADYGPWPHPWTMPQDLIAMAAACGLLDGLAIDASAATLPSYRRIAPTPHREGGRWTGATLMRSLHEAGLLTYLYARFRKR